MALQVIKGALLGGIVWILYAFISFYLLIPMPKENLYSLIFFCIQGIVLGATFSLFTLIIESRYPSILENKAILLFAFVGLICGALSSILNIVLTWVGESESILNEPNLWGSQEILGQLKIDLIKYGIGSSLIGAFFGVSSGYLRKKS